MRTRKIVKKYLSHLDLKITEFLNNLDYAFGKTNSKSDWFILVLIL